MQITDGRFDTALFDVGSFDETPLTFDNPLAIEKHLSRAASPSLVRADEVKLKRTASPTLVRRQE